MKVKRVGVDLAKNVFQLHGVDYKEQVVLRRRLKRENWLKVLLQKIEPGCEIGMEACTGAHHWGRLLEAMGYKVKLIAPQFVKPYVKSNKNDATDAEAICEAMSRPTMRFVEVKTVEQQDIQAIPQWLEDADNGLTGQFRRILDGLWEDLKILDGRVGELNREIESIALNNPVAVRLQTLCGVGPMIATALIAAVGDGQQFSNGRQMAASLGLTPRQHSSGNKERLLGISKRGDSYLRSLLVHGARSAVYAARNKEDRLSQWVTRLAARRHTNVVAVALANKNARMAWAMLRNGTVYDPDRVIA